MLIALQTIILLIVKMLQMAVQGTFILVVLNRKVEFKKIAFFAITSGLGVYIIKFAFGYIGHMDMYIQTIYLIVYFLSIILIEKYVMRISFMKGLLGVVILFIMSTAAEYISFIILDYSLQSHYESIKNSKLFLDKLVGQNIGTVVSFLIMLITYYFRLKVGIPDSENRKTVIWIAVNSILTALLILPNILFFENAPAKMPFNFIIFNSASAVILFVLNMVNTVNNWNLKVGKRQIEFQSLHIKNLEEINDGLRGFKHDYNNMVQAMGGYIALNDLNGLKNYCISVQKETMTINNRISLNTYITNDPALYGLILSKITYSEVKNVNLSISTTTEIITPGVKSYDFCKVIGILFDNAIEAASETEKRKVEFNIFKDLRKNEMVVEFINTFKGNIDIESMFKNGFTTKKDHSGFGLWEVNKIISKYKNIRISTFISGDTFILGLDFKLT